MINFVIEESTASFRQLATTSKHFARRLLTIGGNRLELLTVEVQEERERLLHAFLLALGLAVFSLLAGCECWRNGRRWLRCAASPAA